MGMVVSIFTPAAALAAINPYSQGFIEGYVKTSYTVTEEGAETPMRFVRIESYDGPEYDVRLHRDAYLTIDGIPTSLDAFRPGMEIYGRLRGMSLISLEGFSSANIGYIEPEQKVRTGTVQKIDRNQVQIMTAMGEPLTFFVHSSTLINKKGTPTSLSHLYEGDRVKVYFDEVDGVMASRVEIINDSITIKNLYRGTLQAVDNVNDSLTLSYVRVMENSNWVQAQYTMRMACASKVPVYQGSQKINSDRLKNYRGRDIYFVTRQLWGQERVEKIIIQSQYERLLSSQIQDINWYTEAMELKNNQNIDFHDGTIIVKHGRLVDKYALEKGMDALVVADGRLASDSADVIYVLNEAPDHNNAGQHYIYAGRLDQLVENSLWLKDFFILNEHEWESYQSEKQLYYSYDTSIYDLEEAKFISAEELLAGDYVVDEDSERVQEKGLKNWHVYLYTDGDQVLSMVLQKDMDSLLNQRVSAGQVISVSDDPLVGWTVQLSNMRDWSARNQQWMMRNAGMRLTLSQCMVIKNDRVIEVADLKPGDRLYIVRDDFYGKLLLVK